MPIPPSPANLDAMIRVNQAGEYGAKRIYQGQLATLRDPKARQQVEQMLQQELEHLDYFTTEVAKRQIRPTLLQPFWHFGGFALGAVTALMGKEAAMACTVAVESVIDAHYHAQEQELQDVAGEETLKAKITQFRAEEKEHHDTGLAEGAEEALAYPLLSFAIKTITKTAIQLSTRL
jgi:ubiquinone biosynthesis monooxygenase Coq7